jgi:hypothetical protein
MRGKLGSIARVGAFAALALLLSGCIKLTMDLQVNSDDTVSGTVQLGVQKEILELSGGSVEDLLGTDSPFPSDAPGVSVEEFDDGEFAGQQFTFDSVPITEFQGTDPSDSLSITRQGDTYVVSGVLDLSGASGATGLGATGAQLFESAEIRITMTFPGDVQEASGTIDGNSVTWEPTFGERTEISATASAIDDGDAGGGDGGSSTTIILIVVGALILIAVVAFLVMRGRKGSGAAGEEVATAAEPAAPPGPAPAEEAAAAPAGEAPSPPPAAPPSTPPMAPPSAPPVAPPSEPTGTPPAPPAPPAPPTE